MNFFEIENTITPAMNLPKEITDGIMSKPSVNGEAYNDKRRVCFVIRPSVIHWWFLYEEGERYSLKKWTKTEEKFLREYQGWTYTKIARHLERTYSSVAEKSRKMGLRSR